MKLAGFLLLLAGFAIVLAAIVLFSSNMQRGWFICAGIAVELLGLALVFRSHTELQKERG